MNIDLKQYIFSVLHFELNLLIEDINGDAVDLLYSEYSLDRKDLSSENIKKRYSELLSGQKSDTISEVSNLESEPKKLSEPPLEISLKVDVQKTIVNEKVESPIIKSIPGKAIVIPNAKVNEHYSVSIPLNQNGLNGIVINRIDGLDALGLEFNSNSNQISGSPKVSGEYLLSMEYKHPTESENRPSLFRNLSIYINPDPRSLWTEHEPDSNSIFPKSHTANSEFNFHDKTIVGASKRGRSHAKDAKFRDDHYEIAIDNVSDWMLIAVSDGAGSAKYSREGSKIFCQTVLSEVFSTDNRKHLESVENILDTEDFESKEREIKNHFYYVIGNSLIKGFKEVEEAAKLNDAVVKDFACTFLVSLVKKINGKWFIVGFWVGDGGVGIYFDDKEPIIMGKPDSGEFSGQTRFITMPEILNNSEDIFNRIKLAFVQDFRALALMTDGISDAWFHTDANLFKKEKWDELWLEIKKNQSSETEFSSIALLEWLDFWVKGEYDDRTIVILS